MPPTKSITSSEGTITIIKGWEDVDKNGKRDDSDAVVLDFIDDKGNTTERWVSVSEFVNDKQYEAFGSTADRRKAVSTMSSYKKEGVSSFWRPFRDLACLLYTSPSPRDRQKSRMPSSA